MDKKLEAFFAQLSESALACRVDPVPERNLIDWSSLEGVRPAALFCPRSTAEVSAIMSAANLAGVAVVPQGGLTGLCGGARAVASGIALSLEKLVGIEEIDTDSATMTVLAGTPLETIQRAAADADMYFALDLGARGSCVIGGNVGTNAGGNRVIRYGMTRDLVLGIEAVLPDGTIINALSKLIKNNTGYDVRQLFIGSEGTLGIATRVVLRLYPAPISTHAAVFGLSDYESVLKFLAGARRQLGPMLSAFEAMWSDYLEIALAVPGVRNPLQSRHAFTVLVESQGTDEKIDGERFMGFCETMFEAGVIEDAAVSQSLADVQSFWGLRDACSEFKTTLGPHFAFDIGLPTGKMDEFARLCRTRIADALPGGKSVYYGHIGDGNLHLLGWQPGGTTDEITGHLLDEAVYETVRDFGGSVSAEHGIGLTKKRYLAHSRSPEELKLMKTIKRAIDPNNILNPGKVIDL